MLRSPFSWLLHNRITFVNSYTTDYVEVFRCGSQVCYFVHDDTLTSLNRVYFTNSYLKTYAISFIGLFLTMYFYGVASKGADVLPASKRWTPATPESSKVRCRQGDGGSVLGMCLPFCWRSSSLQYRRDTITMVSAMMSRIIIFRILPVQFSARALLIINAVIYFKIILINYDSDFKTLQNHINEYIHIERKHFQFFYYKMSSSHTSTIHHQ